MKLTATNFNKRFLAILLILTLLSIQLSPLVAPEAEAQAAAAAGAACTGSKAVDAATAGAGGGVAGGATAANAVLAVPVNDMSGNIILTEMSVVQGAQLGEQITENTTWCWKEFVLDVAFYLLNNVLIEQLTASIVNWINGGFEGSPQFTLDLQDTLEDVSQMALGGFVKEISQKTGKDFGLLLCTNFASEMIRGFQVELAVRQSGGKDGESALWRKYQKCDIEETLKSTGSSLESFAQDFSNGGWPAWLEIVEPNNNQYGAYIGLRAELARRLEEAKFIKQTELDWGNGFLSWKKKCAAYDTENFQASTDGNYDHDAPDGQDYIDESSGNVLSTGTSGRCIDPDAGKILTPGSVVENQLNQALGSGQRRVEIADEVNEIIGALLGQLMNQVFGPGGLLGASKSSGGEPSYADQLANSSEQADQLQQITMPQITAQIENIEAYKNIYASAVQDVTSVINLLISLQNCYLTDPTTNASQINQINLTIERLTARKNAFVAKETQAEQLINDYESATSEGDVVLLVQSLSAMDPNGFNTPYVAAQEVQNTNADLADIESQTRTSLTACSGTTQP